MFKKRTINKDGANLLDNQTSKDGNAIIEKRSIQAGIDLRRDIEEMEEIISTKKQTKASHAYEREQQEKQTQKQHNSTFKTKKINKFTSHILKNLPTRINQKQSSLSYQNQNQTSISHSSVLDSKLLQSNPASANNQPIRPQLTGYGLIDMSNFKSESQKGHQSQPSKQKNHQEALIDFYVKKRMEEMTAPKSSNPNKSLPTNNQTVQKQPDAWEQVLQIQKQYLTKQEKIKQYSMEELQKKLQKLAHQTIKTQIQKRNVYLKDLLENQHEKMEYASKKELKIMKQDKERIEKQLNSKYRDFGRRNFIQNIKSQVI